MGQAAFDAKGPALATRLISKFAGPTGTAVLTREVQAAYDPLDGSQAASTSTDTTVDVSPPQKAEQHMITDTVLASHYYSYIASSEFTFVDSDMANVTLTYNSGLKYLLVMFDRIYSGANVAAYTTYWEKI